MAAASGFEHPGGNSCFLAHRVPKLGEFVEVNCLQFSPGIRAKTQEEVV